MFRTDKNWTAYNTTKRYQPQTLQYKIVVRRTSSLCANLIIKSKYYLTIIGFCCCCCSFYIEFSGCHVVINRWISQLTTSHQHLKWPQQFNRNKKRFQIFSPTNFTKKNSIQKSYSSIQQINVVQIKKTRRIIHRQNIDIHFYWNTTENSFQLPNFTVPSTFPW